MIGLYHVTRMSIHSSAVSGHVARYESCDYNFHQLLCSIWKRGRLDKNIIGRDQFLESLGFSLFPLYFTFLYKSKVKHILKCLFLKLKFISQWKMLNLIEEKAFCLLLEATFSVCKAKLCKYIILKNSNRKGIWYRGWKSSFKNAEFFVSKSKSEKWICYLFVIRNCSLQFPFLFYYERSWKQKQTLYSVFSNCWCQFILNSDYNNDN